MHTHATLDPIARDFSSVPFLNGERLDELSTVARLYDKLKELLNSVSSMTDMEQWLETYYSIHAATHQMACVLKIESFQNTEDTERSKAVRAYNDTIVPYRSQAEEELQMAMLGSPYKEAVPQHLLHTFLQSQLTYRLENLPIASTLAGLAQDVTRIFAGRQAMFEGSVQSYVQLSQVLQDDSRPRREAAFNAMAESQLACSTQLDELLDRMIELRQQQAHNAGYANFTDYQFAVLQRVYTPQDCLQFHDTVATEVMPLVEEIQNRQCERLGISDLRPWDNAKKTLSPQTRFSSQSECLGKTAQVLNSLSPEMGEKFAHMASYQLFDLMEREHKRFGGFQEDLAYARLPFIFMNAVGRDKDVQVMSHESGHAFHSMACRHLAPPHFRSPAIETAELASMTTELLSIPHLQPFYAEEEVAGLERSRLEEAICLLPLFTSIDAFQHWLYSHPGHSHLERHEAWVKIQARYSGITNWDGVEARSTFWQAVRHIFLYPFYYIEYGIAQLGALELWRQTQTQPQETLQNFIEALRLGSSVGVPAVYKRAGIDFGFSPEAVRKITQSVYSHLKNSRT